MVTAAEKEYPQDWPVQIYCQISSIKNVHSLCIICRTTLGPNFTWKLKFTYNTPTFSVVSFRLHCNKQVTDYQYQVTMVKVSIIYGHNSGILSRWFFLLVPRQNVTGHVIWLSCASADSNMQVSLLIYVERQVGLCGSCNCLSQCCKWTFMANSGLICHFQGNWQYKPLFEGGNNGTNVRIILEILRVFMSTYRQS